MGHFCLFLSSVFPLCCCSLSINGYLPVFVGINAGMNVRPLVPIFMLCFAGAAFATWYGPSTVTVPAFGGNFYSNTHPATSSIMRYSFQSSRIEK
jgi:hypothetical protein